MNQYLSLRLLLTKLQRLSHLDETFNGLRFQAESLQSMQHSHIKTQSQLHNQMQQQMQSTAGFLNDISASTAALGAQIEATSVAIGAMAAIGGITTTIFAFGKLSFVVAVLYFFGRRYAATGAGVVGKLPVSVLKAD